MNLEDKVENHFRIDIKQKKALEKIGVHAGLEGERIGKDEVLEVLLAQLAREETPRLVAELRDALVYQPLVDRVVEVHRGDASPPLYSVKD